MNTYEFGSVLITITLGSASTSYLLEKEKKKGETRIN
jgi:hypothetical protein